MLGSGRRRAAALRGQLRCLSVASRVQALPVPVQDQQVRPEGAVPELRGQQPQPIPNQSAPAGREAEQGAHRPRQLSRHLSRARAVPGRTHSPRSS